MAKKKDFFEKVEEFIPGASKKLIAKKDFKIVHNDYVLDIKQGDDLSDVPEMYLANLKTEQVI